MSFDVVLIYPETASHPRPYSGRRLGPLRSGTEDEAAHTESVGRDQNGVMGK